MTSFDPIKNQADFIRNNGIDAFGSMGAYLTHQENLWNRLKANALKDSSDTNEKEKENENENQNL